MKSVWRKGLAILGIMIMLLGASGCGTGADISTDSQLGEDKSVASEITEFVKPTESTEASETTDAKETVEIPESVNNSKTSTSDASETGETSEKKASPTMPAGTAPAPGEKKPELTEKVTLRVTKDFGREVIFHQTVPIKKDWTVMDLLDTHLEIETKFEGSFINGINGLASEKGGFTKDRYDWFFYVNGVSADVGAAAYQIQGGDQVWWDYHVWRNMSTAIPALIGSYPEPFINSYLGKVGPITVMSSPEDQELADKVVRSLKSHGAKNISTGALDASAMENRKGPVLVLGSFPELKKISWLDKFNEAYRKTGTGVHFTDKGVELFTSNGELGETVTGSAGVIVASGEGLGDESPLWLIMGTDIQGLTDAVEILTNSPYKISGMYQAAVVSGEVRRLPLEPK
jgi:hypothetical protein